MVFAQAIGDVDRSIKMQLQLHQRKIYTFSEQRGKSSAFMAVVISMRNVCGDRAYYHNCSILDEGGFWDPR